MLSKSDLRIFLNSRRYNDIFIDPNNSPQKLCISQTMLIRFKPNQVGFNSQLVFKPNQTWLNCSLVLNQTEPVAFLFRSKPNKDSYNYELVLHQPQ